MHAVKTCHNAEQPYGHCQQQEIAQSGLHVPYSVLSEDRNQNQGKKQRCRAACKDKQQRNACKVRRTAQSAILHACNSHGGPHTRYKPH